MIINIISPGKKLNHQAISITLLPSLNKLPQLIFGGLIPSPKNDNPDSANIAPATPKEKEIKKIGANSGAKYFKIIFFLLTFDIFRIFINALFDKAKL
ncbi:hypothetical protein AAX29_01708 [Aliarcobacter thereius]|uniref:Uncharacterized protein n=1 Tax=Aliarcobacter thereius TaxID=544718 RepID=A0A1C0B5K0_9BACT|nr:hypothetical protein AAX29_01708 [Aliarcobacter thereius]